MDINLNEHPKEDNEMSSARLDIDLNEVPINMDIDLNELPSEHIETSTDIVSVQVNSESISYIDLNELPSEHIETSTDIVSVQVNSESILGDGHDKEIRNVLDINLNELPNENDDTISSHLNSVQVNGEGTSADGGDDFDFGPTIPKKKRGRPPKRRKMGTKVPSGIVISEPTGFVKLPLEEEKETSKFKGKVDVNVDSNEQDITAPKKTTRGRPRKDKTEGVSRVSEARETTGICGECSLLKDKRRGKNRALNEESRIRNILKDKKNFSLLSWMIAVGTLQKGLKVKCMNKRTQKWVKGTVTKKGLICDCHVMTFSLAEFEVHSESSTGQPLHNIFLESRDSLLETGDSLLKCLECAWIIYREDISLKSYRIGIDDDSRNDDICSICGDGGDLMGCCSCSTSVHKKCLNIQTTPSGDWNCVYCSCMFCGTVGERSRNENHNRDSSVPALPTCSLCKKKYPLLHVQEKDTSQAELNASTFCSQNFQKIFEKLKMILGAKQQMEGEFSWTLLRHSDDNLDISTTSGARNVECNAKLAIAWSVIDGCFSPIIDQGSGINMIHKIVHNCGSKIRRIDYGGFFTAVLEKGDEIVSAVTLRIHGNRVAEMPFAATNRHYRRKGMCRRLLNGVEKALSFLNVEKLVLSSIRQTLKIWTTDHFNFKPLDESQNEEMKYVNIVSFRGTVLLQKPVPKEMLGAESLTFTTGE